MILSWCRGWSKQLDNESLGQNIAPLMLSQLSLYSDYAKNLKRAYPTGWSLAGMPWYGPETKGLLMSMPASRQKVKLDQSSFDARLRPANARAHAKLLASNLANASREQKHRYEEWIYADLVRQQVGAFQSIRSGQMHTQITGGLTGGGTVYGYHVTSAHAALINSLAFSENLPYKQAADLLKGLVDGEDSVHAFETPIDLERLQHFMRVRHDLISKIEWSKDSVQIMVR